MSKQPLPDPRQFKSKVSEMYASFRKEFESIRDDDVDENDPMLPPQCLEKLRRLRNAYLNLALKAETVFEVLGIAFERIQRSQPEPRQTKRDKRICNLAAKGYKPMRIVRLMRESKWPTNDRKEPWTVHAVRQIIKRGRQELPAHINEKKSVLPRRPSKARVLKLLRAPNQVTKLLGEIWDDMHSLTDEERSDPSIIERLRQLHRTRILRLCGFKKKHIEQLERERS